MSTHTVVLIAFLAGGVFLAAMVLLVWGLCIAAARGDRAMREPRSRSFHGCDAWERETWEPFDGLTVVHRREDVER